MENRPIVFIQSGGDDRKLPNEYPSYTAYSRWPRLHPDNRLPTTLPLPANHHSQQQQQQERQQQLQQKLQQQLKQQLDQTRSSQINPAPPAPDRPLYNQRFAQQQQQQQLVGRGRPGSLQEAILTVRPLRQVRPRITAIPDGYP
ncbi:hypothetical protein O3M35_001459 [Rhynocoris fuscipes]|uniref:Uncharacterized protein n=1 Tax=Rhynocoris fuscipes TaxID=488301 RepID=A0AAW1CMJ8_9HEMI